MKLTQDFKRNIIIASKLCAVIQAAGSHRFDSKAIGGDLVAFFVP